MCGAVGTPKARRPRSKRSKRPQFRRGGRPPLLVLNGTLNDRIRKCTRAAPTNLASAPALMLT